MRPETRSCSVSDTSTPVSWVSSTMLTRRHRRAAFSALLQSHSSAKTRHNQSHFFWVACCLFLQRLAVVVVLCYSSCCRYAAAIAVLASAPTILGRHYSDNKKSSHIVAILQHTPWKVMFHLFQRMRLTSAHNFCVDHN